MNFCQTFGWDTRSKFQHVSRKASHHDSSAFAQYRERGTHGTAGVDVLRQYTFRLMYRSMLPSNRVAGTAEKLLRHEAHDIQQQKLSKWKLIQSSIATKTHTHTHTALIPPPVSRSSQTNTSSHLDTVYPTIALAPIASISSRGITGWHLRCGWNERRTRQKMRYSDLRVVLLRTEFFGPWVYDISR